MLLYMYSVLLAVIIPTIMGALFPLGAECYESTLQLLHKWKSMRQKRSTVGSKALRALKPIGFNVGGFFTFKKETTAGVFEQIMDYTVNAILSF